MGKSLEYMEMDQGMTVLEAWFQRIDFRLKSERYPDEYELSVADDLLKFTKDRDDIRRPLFDLIINHKDTNFILSSIKWMIAHWDQLSIYEKERIRGLASSEREDVRWIKAVILNHHQSPPAEIQSDLFNDAAFFDKDINFIVRHFPEGLLQDCLSVYCGHPQPLWLLAVHHHNMGFWGKINRRILENPDNPHFGICLREMLSDGANGFSSHWKDGPQIFKQICTHTSSLEVIAKRLIFETGTCNFAIDSTKELWDILIDAYAASNNLDVIKNMVANNIEMLQRSVQKEELLEIFDKNFFFGRIYPLIVPDSTIFMTLHQLAENRISTEAGESVLSALLLGLESIRFSLTQNIINKLLPKTSINDALKADLGRLPDLVRKIGEAAVEKLNRIEEYKLSNWIGQN